MRKLILAACVLIVTAFISQSFAQLASGQSKFLGNIVGSSVPSNFSTYWNQITPENSSKWGSVESSRDVMNWTALDVAYNYAVNNGYKFKLHTLVWGSQYPSWITSLSQSEQLAEIEEWMSALASRYPNTWAVDVVNEPINTTCPFKDALGGDGNTGWDWVITAFQLARQYFPNQLLILNEYGTENNATSRSTMLTIIGLLQDRGLIDGIGLQAHAFTLDYMSASALTTCLNAYAATGLDIYISELDIRGANATISESAQSAEYQSLFPVMWEHSSVKGITLWGYIEGQTWLDGTGIVQSDGTEKAAMTWLKSYMSGSSGSGSNTIVVRALGTNGDETVTLTVGSTVIGTWTMSTSYQDYTATTDLTGGILVSFTNDNGTTRDVRVDYITVNGTTLQAEDQSYNTGVWQNSACGGSYSEWMHCDGAIGFSGSNLSKDAIEIEEDTPVPAGYALYQNYPNPFNPTTIIEYEIQEAGFVKLTISDAVGRVVKTLVEGRNTAGNHSIIFNADGMPSGVYFYTLQAGTNVITKKMILLK